MPYFDLTAILLRGAIRIFIIIIFLAQFQPLVFGEKNIFLILLERLGKLVELRHKSQ